MLWLWTVMIAAGCEPEAVPKTPPLSGQNSSSSSASGGRGTDHSEQGSRQADLIRKEQELQKSMDFAKSELKRFEVTLKERQALSDDRIAKAQLKVDEQQNKINSFANIMASRALTSQQTLELEQAKRDKTQAEKQVEAEKNVKSLNENPIESLIDSKRKEIEKLEADLSLLRSEAAESGEE